MADTLQDLLKATESVSLGLAALAMDARKPLNQRHFTTLPNAENPDRESETLTADKVRLTELRPRRSHRILRRPYIDSTVAVLL